MSLPTEQPPTGQIFSQVRVLDLADELAIAGSRLLAALGAEVLRPEPTQGSSVGGVHPATTSPEGDQEPGLKDIVHNVGKAIVMVDVTPEGLARICELAAGSDAVLLSSTSPYAVALRPSPREWADQHPEVVLVIVDAYHPESPFYGGPFADLTIGAASGFDWYCGAVEGPPEHPKGDLALGYTGIAAAVAIAVGIGARSYHNRPDWFELTAQEAFAFACMQSGDPNQWIWHGLVPSRREWGETASRSLNQCLDDRWLTFVMLGAHFDELADWLDRANVSDAFHGDEWLDREYYLIHQHEFVGAIAELCRRNNRDDIVREGQARGLMVMPLSSISDLLADPQLSAREMFHETETPVGALRLPRAPVVYSRTPVPTPHAATCFPETAKLMWDRKKEIGSRQALPLAGMRVADFTWMLAAPVATRILGDMGADVIRIESHHRRDMTREIGPQPPGYFSLDTNSTQHHASSNKRSIALNLKRPEAVELAREIIGQCDIVFENYTPGTMAKWGLDPESILRQWPGHIVVSQPAVGYTGPHAHWGAIGNGVAGYGGINMLTGFARNRPFGVGPIVSDLIAPMISVTSLLAAVEHRRRTGEGQHVDCGMLEATLWMLGTEFAECQLVGHDPARTGNRSQWMSPHGIFGSKGDDEWIAIAIRSDSEWAIAARELGLASLLHDPRFASFDARKRNEDELEAEITRATRERDRWQLAEALSSAGVPAAPVESIRDQLERDPGTRIRYSALRHPYGFDFLVANQFIRPHGETVPNRRAPMIGEHSDAILREVLGKSDEQVADLIMNGIVE